MPLVSSSSSSSCAFIYVLLVCIVHFKYGFLLGHLGLVFKLRHQFILLFWCKQILQLSTFDVNLFGVLNIP